MKRVKVASAALGLIIGVLAAVPASAWERGTVNTLFTLPDLIGQPTTPPPPPAPQPCCGVKSSVEGLTVGLPAAPGRAADNNIYAASSGVNSGLTPRVTGPANLFVLDSGGRLLRQVMIQGTSNVFGTAVNGIRFNPVTTVLWVLDAANGQVLNVDTSTGGSSVLANGFPAGATLNAVAFDNIGNGYVTDSTNGAIYKIPSAGGSFTTWSSDALLKPVQGLKPFAPITPPFGANGIDFSQPGGCDLGSNVGTPCFLYVANTANRQILQYRGLNSDGTGAPPVVEVNGVNGPDGIVSDGTNLWVCAGQEDEIVVLNLNSQLAPTGKVMAKLGDFHGLTSSTSTTNPATIKGLLFPASLAFSNDKTTLYVSNLASQSADSIDSAWARQVKTYTISSLAATIPPQ